MRLPPRLSLRVAAAFAGLAILGGVFIGHYAWKRGGGTVVGGATVGANVATGSDRLKHGLGIPLTVVIMTPHIHSLFWSKQFVFGSGKLRFNAKALAGVPSQMISTGYLNSLEQYGSSGASVDANPHFASTQCGDTTPPASITTHQLIDWIVCEVGTDGTSVPQPSAPPNPLNPVSDDLYVVYVSPGTTITDNFSTPHLTIPLGPAGNFSIGPFTLLVRNSCADYGAYHLFAHVQGKLFAFAIVPLRCSPNFSDATRSMGHEVVEAITDPLINAGWIDTDIPITPPDYRRLSEGEAEDICSSVGAVPSHSVPFGSFSLDRYWSNDSQSCVAG